MPLPALGPLGPPFPEPELRPLPLALSLILLAHSAFCASVYRLLPSLPSRPLRSACFLRHAAICSAVGLFLKLVLGSPFPPREPPPLACGRGGFCMAWVILSEKTTISRFWISSILAASPSAPLKANSNFKREGTELVSVHSLTHSLLIVLQNTKKKVSRFGPRTQRLGSRISCVLTGCMSASWYITSERPKSSSSSTVNSIRRNRWEPNSLLPKKSGGTRDTKLMLG